MAGTYNTNVDADIIAEVAREHSIGAGGLKGLLCSPNKEDLDSREMKMVKEAYRRQADRDGIESPV